MKLNSNHTLYKQADATCSRTQLVLMLCDGVIRYAREAADHMRGQRWAEKGQAVDAAFECLTELRRGLNLREGGEAARSLDRMYDFLCTKLSLGNAARDPSQLDQVAVSMQEIRTSWLELFDRLKAEGKLLETEAAELAP
jgi:flagellar secretion chaperone FliS